MPRRVMGEELFEVEISHEGRRTLLESLLAAVPISRTENEVIRAEICNEILKIYISAGTIKTVRSLGDKVMVAMSEIEESFE